MTVSIKDFYEWNDNIKRESHCIEIPIQTIKPVDLEEILWDSNKIPLYKIRMNYIICVCRKKNNRRIAGIISTSQGDQQLLPGNGDSHGEACQR